MKLSPRLKAVVSLLESPVKVADVGTDHAYIPIYLAKNTNCCLIIATEYNELPYQGALRQVKEAGLEDIIEVRKGFGLSVLKPGEVDAIIIAGMGGFTIKEILAEEIKLAQSTERLILQPMTKIKELRKWLLANNFKLIKEKLAREKNKFYQVLSITSGKMEIEDDFLLEVGPKLIRDKDPLLISYLNRLEARWRKIVKEISQEDTQSPKLNQLMDKINRLQEVKRWL